MRNFVTRHLDQNRISLYVGMAFTQTHYGGWLEKYIRDIMNGIRKIFKRHRLFGCSVITLFDEFSDMVPSSHVFGFVVDYFLTEQGIFFLIGPLFRVSFFLLLFVSGKQMIEHGLPAHSPSITQHLHRRRFWIFCDELFICALPVDSEFWFCGWGFLQCPTFFFERHSVQCMVSFYLNLSEIARG